MVLLSVHINYVPEELGNKCIASVKSPPAGIHALKSRSCYTSTIHHLFKDEL